MSSTSASNRAAEPPVDAPLPDAGRRRVLGLSLPLMAATCGWPGAGPVQAAPAAPGAAGRRSALVVGNAQYPDALLRNPVRDARLMAAALQELGFDVLLAENASRDAMYASVRQWLIASSDAQVRAFYYAGHGVQYRGSNFLVPVDAVFLAEDEIPQKAFNLGHVVEPLSRTATGVNFIIMDACRSEPAALLTRVQRRTRSIEESAGPGLMPQVAPRGTVIAYSTSPGSLAADGAADANSVFTRNLVQQLRRPGVPIETMFKRVRMAVMRETRNAQVPWESSSLVGDFCLQPNAEGVCQPDG
jgi:uncharacterized caspase-like protein